MEDNNIPQMQAAAMRPLVKLAYANAQLLTHFSTASDTAQAFVINTQNLLAQGQKTAIDLAPWNALTHLSQGLLRNYIEFATDMGQTGMANWVQGQQNMQRLAQEPPKPRAVAPAPGARPPSRRTVRSA